MLLDTLHADSLKEEDVAVADRKWSWLGTGDWTCTDYKDGIWGNKTLR